MHWVFYFKHKCRLSLHCNLWYTEIYVLFSSTGGSEVKISNMTKLQEQIWIHCSLKDTWVERLHALWVKDSLPDHCVALLCWRAGVVRRLWRSLSHIMNEWILIIKLSLIGGNFSVEIYRVKSVLTALIPSVQFNCVHRPLFISPC